MAAATQGMDFDALTKAVKKAHPEALVADAPHEKHLEATAAGWGALAGYLRSDPQLNFDSLMCLTGYDEGVEGSLIVIYNFFSMEHRHKLEVRVKVSREGGSLPSVANIWRTADWHEREAYDLYGMTFEGHPDHRRILLPEDWEGHPLKKDFVTPDYYRGIPVPKDKRGWE